MASYKLRTPAVVYFLCQILLLPPAFSQGVSKETQPSPRGQTLPYLAFIFNAWIFAHFPHRPNWKNSEGRQHIFYLCLLAFTAFTSVRAVDKLENHIMRHIISKCKSQASVLGEASLASLSHVAKYIQCSVMSANSNHYLWKCSSATQCLLFKCLLNILHNNS